MAKPSGNISCSVGHGVEDAEGASDTGRRQKKQSICVGLSGFIRGYMAKPSIAVSVRDSLLQRPTNTTDQSPPTDDVTHLSQRAHKNSNYKRRAPLEPDQPPSPPKRLRLTLLQTPNSISQYQVLHPEQQSGTPFDRGKFQ